MLMIKGKLIELDDGGLNGKQNRHIFSEQRRLLIR